MAQFDGRDGVWFIYGRDTNAYPVNMFDDELEARRAKYDWERIVFWPFGVAWDDLDSPL